MILVILVILVAAGWPATPAGVAPEHTDLNRTEVTGPVRATPTPAVGPLDEPTAAGVALPVTGPTTSATTSVPPAVAGPAAPAAARRVVATPWLGTGAVEAAVTCGDLTRLGVSWHYNWTTRSGCGRWFVPMIWGDWCAGGAACGPPEDVAGSGADTLLTFNEPDSATQANMSVERAILRWPLLEETGLRLSSPAVSSNDAGRAWLDAFMAQADAGGLRVDFVAAHWYGDCRDEAALVTYLRDLRRFERPVWLTEFSCWYGDAATNQRFLAAALPALASLTFVERVAWFTTRRYPNGYEHTNLIELNGTLSPAGETFVAEPPCRVGIARVTC